MLTTIQIAGLQTFGYHGLFEEERRLGQKFTFDIDATLNPAPTHRDDQLDASIRYDAVVDAAVSLAGELKYQTLEALGEAVAIGLLRRFALIDTISVGVSKFSPPIPHTLSKVGIVVRLVRADLADRPADESLKTLVRVTAGGSMP
jgi:dihydroneopterin aldolase